MSFSDAQLRAWVLDNGTRFAPESARTQLRDEDVHRAFAVLYLLSGFARPQTAALGFAATAILVDFQLCSELTDASMITIAGSCRSLTSLDVRYAFATQYVPRLTLSASAHMRPDLPPGA